MDEDFEIIEKRLAAISTEELLQLWAEFIDSGEAHPFDCKVYILTRQNINQYFASPARAIEAVLGQKFRFSDDFFVVENGKLRSFQVLSDGIDFDRLSNWIIRENLMHKHPILSEIKAGDTVMCVQGNGTDHFTVGKTYVVQDFHGIRGIVCDYWDVVWWHNLPSDMFELYHSQQELALE